MCTLYHFDDNCYKKFILNTLVEYIPILIYNGLPAINIKEYITRNHVSGREKKLLTSIDLFISTHSSDIAEFILSRLSIMTTLTIERVLRRHSLPDRSQACLALAIVTGYMAFCVDTPEEGRLDEYVSSHTRAEVTRIAFERRRGVLLNRINSTAVIPVNDSDNFLPFNSLHSMAFPDTITNVASTLNDLNST